MFAYIVFGGLAAAISLIIIIWEGLAVYRINKKDLFGRFCYYAINHRFHVGTFIAIISIPMMVTAGVTLFAMVNIMNAFVSLLLYISYVIWVRVENNDINRGFMKFAFIIIKLLIKDKHKHAFEN